MQHTQWIKITFFTTIFSFILLGAINYIIDPFHIFHSNILKKEAYPNIRFNKIKFLEENHEKYNSYMIGSSRIGTTSPLVLEQYLPQSKFYNLSMDGATLYNSLMNLRFMIKEKYDIKNIYLQLDVDTIASYGVSSNSLYIYKLHPKVEGKSLTLYYLDYLSNIFILNSKAKILQNLHPSPITAYDKYLGTWSNKKVEEEISRDCKKYTHKVTEFQTSYKRIIRYTTKKETIKALKEMVELCKKNHIKLYTFITPHNHKMMDSFVIDDYLEYLQDIASITDFYDFSGYNSVTNNDCNYYEISHFRPHIGALIASKIFEDTNHAIANDFGKLVTSKNIETHLRKRRDEIITHDKQKRTNNENK